MARWTRRERKPAEPARRATRAIVAVALALGGIATTAHAAEPAAVLRFAAHGETVAELDLAALRERADAATVRVFEPYERAEVAFRALPLARVLDAVYGRGWRDEEELLLTCRDGYQPTVPVARVLAHRAWLAFERVDAGFAIRKRESGRIQSIELDPFYVIWENLDDPVVRREGDYGWPYQLVGVDLIRARDRFPRMAPPETASPAALAGFTAFRIHCSRCHTIHGEGSSLGPELNDPARPVGRRDPAWLRRWIDDPSQTAATARMPALNPDLPDRQRTIDEIVAYLQAVAPREDEAAAAPGSFESFYGSAAHHPLALWLATGTAIGLVLVRRGLHRSVRRYALALGALSLLDAWLTSTHVIGVGALPASLASAVPLCFVLAGDFRYLLLVTSGTREGAILPGTRSVLGAAGLTLIVPIAAQIAVRALAPDGAGPRVLYLVYEIAFFALAAALTLGHPRPREAPWLRALGCFVMLYYGLWACADAILLGTGSDLAYALRVVPNLLYYGGLIAAIAWLAPRTAGSAAGPPERAPRS